MRASLLSILFSILTGSLLAAEDRMVCVLEEAPSSATSQAAPILCWSTTRSQPRPLRIHFLRVDLDSTRLAVDALVPDDPDGDGPAEAALTDPLEMFKRSHAIAAVNANAFQALPDADGKRDSDWFEGKPVDIVGLAAGQGLLRSPGEVEHLPFWIDRKREARLGPAPDEGAVIAAVSDWHGRLLEEGHVVPPEDGVLHPRTMLGLDREARVLTLCVVDGRQPGFSEGVSLWEGAGLLKENGSQNAINLDGGGSSLLLLAGDEDGAPRIVNSPSGGKPRPIPVMLAVRPTRRP